MKSSLKRKLKAVRKEIKKMQVLEVLIDAIIVFLAFAIPLTFFNLSVFFALIPFIIYLGYRILVVGIESEHSLVENIAAGNPSLKEQIETAYDNRKYMGRNIVLTSLNYDVSRNMDKTGVSSLLDTRKLVNRTVAAVFMAFLLLTINFIGFDFGDLEINFGPDRMNNILNDLSNTLGFDLSDELGFGGDKREYVADDRYRVEEEIPELGGSSGGILPGFEEGEIPDAGTGAGASGDEDIFGDPTSAKIEGDNVDMKLPPEYGGNIEIRDVNEGSGTLPWEGNIEGGAGSGMETEAAIEYANIGYREMVKKYFQSIQEEV